VSFSRRPLWWQALHQTGLVLTLACAAVLANGTAQAREAPRGGSGASVALAQLPAEAQSTYQLILSGGPFPGRKDGVVFGNRERALPREPRGFYHEYTVNTPGARNRGARRIVCGGREMARPEACYYTGDHYASFQQIVQ
jgi:ribonuclease T1